MKHGDFTIFIFWDLQICQPKRDGVECIVIRKLRGTKKASAAKIALVDFFADRRFRDNLSTSFDFSTNPTFSEEAVEEFFGI